MRQNAKKIIRIGIFSVFFILIALYALSRSYDLVLGVKIKNINVTDGATITESVFLIKGTAKNATNLTLNNREISIDQDGNFNETIALLPGYNVISIRAEDKFGNVDEKDYKIMYLK